VNSIEEWLTQPGGLATRLQELRKQACLTGVSMGRALTWTQSKISEIETGKQMPSADDVAAWAGSCGAGTAAPELLELLAEAQALHRDWKQQTRLGQVAIQRNYDDLARQATVIRNAELTVVPGLLQTPEYARARIAENVRLHHSNEQEIAAATAERIRRQEVLYDTTKRFEFVITEAVLRFLLCPPPVMIAQLDRLLGLTAGMAHVSFGVIPFGVELPITPQNTFILFDDLAVVETHLGRTMHHSEEAASYAEAMDNLRAEAWTEDQARHLIIRATDDLRNSMR
jgi:transcriptional regulator with XRE-family HTH domain